ncbi:hypothetical protein [Tepidiforma sp.]|uniref:hypothetical protein n=1 Tax=Tepidiforma sp. TaxID=2682230 RepID=UPI002ADDFC79|nr:hypothetical protein [Tepidiforma sp.]
MGNVKLRGAWTSWLGYFGLALAACLPCLAIPLAAAVLGGSGVGLALGFAGVSAVLAALAGLAVSAMLVVLRLRRRVSGGGVSCPIEARDAGH